MNRPVPMTKEAAEPLVRTSYIETLAEAIENCSADALAADAAAFTYRGADLRHAVARSVYFSLVNDSSVMAAYDGADPASRALAAHVESRFSPPTAEPKPSSSDPLRAAVRRLRSFIGGRPVVEVVEQAAEGGRPSVAMVEDAAEFRTYRVLFIALQPKFVAFLAPIAARFGSDAAFLTIDDFATARYLTERQLPAVALKVVSRPAAPVAAALSPFADLCSAYDAVAAYVARARPDVFVVPEGNAPVYELVRLAAAAANIPTLCIQHGWSPVSHPGFRGLAFDEMLVWGEGFAQLLATHNPQQKFSAAGNPNIAADEGRRARGRAVQTIGFFLQKGGPLITPDDWSAFLDFISWTAEAFPDVSIIIRDHPSTPALDDDERSRVGAHENISFNSPSTATLREVLAECDIVLSMYSTTLLEALAAGAIPFIFRPSRLGRYHPDLEALGAGVEVSNLAEATERLSDLIAQAWQRESLLRAAEAVRPTLFVRTGAHAVEHIAAQIGLRLR